MKLSTYSTIGDVGHVLALTLALFYCFLAGYRMSDPHDRIFDDQWKLDGFCVTNKQIPYWTSHDMCLYVDTLISAALGITYYTMGRKTPQMEEANMLVLSTTFGTLAHGMAHGFIGRDFRLGKVVKEKGSVLDFFRNQPTWIDFFVVIAVSVALWGGLLRASLAKLPFRHVAAATAAIMTLQLFTPEAFGFTYVQTVLVLVYGISQLQRERSEKDFGYAIYPYVVSLPLISIAWLESVACTSFLRDKLYGHAAYDGYLAMSTLVWYLIRIHKNQKKASFPKKDV